jgi:hypothetical protein
MEASTVVPPPAIAEALGYMQRPCACPEDVKAKIMALRVPSEGVTGTRMNTNWRAGPPVAAAAAGSGGYRGVSGGRGRGGYGGGGDRGVTPRAFGRPPPTAAAAASAPRFGNKSRTDVTTEERMMDRIREKMNKFSLMTYDATKTWLSQLLDSGETEFLDDFITLVFEKAAAEPTFCALYARLITELRTAFPHLSGELRRIFNSFIGIFEEAAEEPAMGSVEYSAFVAMRERRRNRRGYASFVGEAAQNGAFTIDDVSRTCGVILDGLCAARLDAEKQQLTEEYADCLATLMMRCKPMLKASASIAGLLSRIQVAQKKEESAPGITNKARFCLMDITDGY